METLLLDVGYQPLKRIPWTEAIVKVYFDRKARVIEAYPDKYIRSATWQVEMPSVIALLKPVPMKKAVKFSRHGIYARDRGMCQYCGAKVKKSEMQYEHVVPRAQGGRTCWENIVVACLRCNQQKADRTPAQAGMHLLSTPVRPKSLPNINGQVISFNPKSMPESWRSYIYWNVELEHDGE